LSDKVIIMSKPVDAGARQRVREAVSKLIWDQVRPWVYMDTDGVSVVTFDGRRLSFVDKDSPGAREVLWNDYIEPFLKDLCHSEIATTTTWAKAHDVPLSRALHELRTAFLGEFIRLYWTMADVHRQTWFKLPNGLIRRDTTEDVDRMMAFLDMLIVSVLKESGEAPTWAKRAFSRLSTG
jgi:hypothetical protein